MIADSTPTLLASLETTLSPGSVFLDAASRHRASLDSARLSRQPSAVIRPRDEADIAALLRLANETRTPVTVRGSGSATTASATPVEGGWVLDLAAWNTIRIDPELGFATVGAGALTKAVDDAARAYGWFYPPDPSSAAYCTIGGNIATNAGGLRGAKYGVTRDYVVALRGFLPTGEAVRWGLPLRKYASGFNLRDLWIGSEGMLGVITEAVLKLRRLPAARWTALAIFPHEATALGAARAILRAGVIPSVLEFLDRQSVGCAERFTGRSLSGGLPSAALLLVELDGHPAEVAEDADRLLDLLQDRAADLQVARDPAAAEALWHARRTCSPAMFALGDTKLNEDVVVPPDAYGPLLEATLAIKEATGLATPTFGHVADGNFHVHIMYNHADTAQTTAAVKALHQLMERVVALGGAITGEHGIGLAKSPFFRLQHLPAEIAAMQRIKAALDPANILNPDKLFTPLPLWEHPRDRTTQLPWDKRH